jgi:DNA transposition AAA+ family ATPase
MRLGAVGSYLDLTGIHPADFARRIGYSKSTIGAFLAGRYGTIGGDTGKVLAAAETYMAAHPVRPSRSLHGELFETANVRLIRETFAKLLLRPRAFIVYAPPGSQKSFVLEHEVYELNRRELAHNADGARAYCVYASQDITPYGLILRIAKACGLRVGGTRDQIIDRLREEHRRRRCLLVIDEAQHLSIECFEAVRELLDREPYFSLLFAGSHDLHLKFERSSATLEQWNSRIAQKVRLPGCTPEEALGIIDREIGAILATKPKAAERAQKIVERCTVADAYIPVADGQPKATYINIRTLCNTLDDLQIEYAKSSAQKEVTA